MAKSDNIEVQSVEQKDNKLEVTINTNGKTKKPHLVKHIGEYIDGDAKVITFLATRKELLLFRTDTSYLQFRNHMFRTNDSDIIEYIKTHPIFNQEIFDGDYPPAIKKKMEEYRSKFTRDPDEHELGYARQYGSGKL